MGEVILPAAVRVPGSSANLGPGFDVLGLALEIYLEARVDRSAPGRPLVQLAGPHTEGISADESEVEARLQAMAGEQGLATGSLRETYGEGLAEALRAQLCEEKALEFLAAQAKIEETTDT